MRIFDKGMEEEKKKERPFVFDAALRRG